MTANQQGRHGVTPTQMTHTASVAADAQNITLVARMVKVSAAKVRGTINYGLSIGIPADVMKQHNIYGWGSGTLRMNGVHPEIQFNEGYFKRTRGRVTVPSKKATHSHAFLRFGRKTLPFNVPAAPSLHAVEIRATIIPSQRRIVFYNTRDEFTGLLKNATARTRADMGPLFNPREEQYQSPRLSPTQFPTNTTVSVQDADITSEGAQAMELLREWWNKARECGLSPVIVGTDGQRLINLDNAELRVVKETKIG